MNCINCNNELTSNFCPNCGENSTVPKITFSSIIANTFSSVTNMDKGFLYNLKHLISNPRKIVMDYVKGKRKNILNPLSFLIMTITIYLIVDSFFKAPKFDGNKDPSFFYSVGSEAGKFMKLYSKYFWFLSIIWLSISTKLVFKRFNYAEHLAINSFVIGLSTLISLVGFVFFKYPLVFNPIIYAIVLWMTYKIFGEADKASEPFMLSMISTILFFLQLVAVLVSIGIINTIF